MLAMSFTNRVRMLAPYMDAALRSTSPPIPAEHSRLTAGLTQAFVPSQLAMMSSSRDALTASAISEPAY
jgi:hypothetical protein